MVHLCFHGFASSGVVDFMVGFWRVVWGSARCVSGDLFWFWCLVVCLILVVCFGFCFGLVVSGFAVAYMFGFWC